MKRKSNKLNFGSIILLIAIIIYGAFTYINESYSLPDKTIEQTEQVNNIKDGNLQIQFIDVGQADSILINDNGTYMLIDAGNNEDGNKLTNYLKTLNINEFKFVVGTHAHEDHIGGMDNIIDNFKINTFYMPDVITTTKTFESVLDSLEKENVTFETPKEDSILTLDNAKINVLYVGNDEKNLNNSSIVLKLTYGNTSVLFTGDAETEVEKKLLNKDLKADVLKLGHHGSATSTSDEFLNLVNPTYSIISVGLNNSYKHPSSKTLEKLNKNNIQIYRTDENGTIIMTSDGNNIKFETIKTDTNG